MPRNKLINEGGEEMEKREYEKPVLLIVNLNEIDEVVAYARCNGGAWSAGGCS